MEISYQDVKDGMNYCAGAASGFAIYKCAPKYIMRPFGKQILSNVKKVTKEENDIFWSSANKAYNNSNLSNEAPEIKSKEPKPKIHTKQRVIIRHLDDTNKNQIIKEIKGRTRLFEGASITKTWLWKILYGDPRKKFNRSIEATAAGQNAFCIPHLTNVNSLVAVNKDKMAFSTFHELGHAINAHSSGIKKILSKTRGLFALFPPIILLAGILSNKPKETNPNLMTSSEKQIMFIKNNCGLMAGLCMLPTVMEEGLASINGAKLAKDVLNKDMYKKLNKLNTKAWCSYLLGAAIIGATVQAAVKIRDKIVDYKPIKL